MAQYLVAGVTSGAAYALLALALVLVLKATDVPNFAAAAMGLMPTFAAWNVLSSGASYLLAVGVLIATGAGIGLLSYLGPMRLLLGQPHHVAVVATIALWFVLNSSTGLIWDPNTRSIEAPFAGAVRVGDTVVSRESLAILLAAGGAALGLHLMFRTQLGLYMRAVALDAVAPQLLGVSVRGLSAVAWGLAGVIASVAVFLYAQSSVLSLGTGDGILLGAFVAATLGGFASIWGALVGGLSLGMIEGLAGAYISTAGQAAVGLVVVLIVLLVRPSGVLGERVVRDL